ncbi:glycosyltransferase family 87 protein [Paludisphaera mucosa]|uniref:Glycosyltransferase family 87 protein n=1 Tax=Paludisphaera mucosa TaxID=3030827 RepID=A0ABT6F5C9_9BACT|nr:glycosyltransferase family 87 protein [Paludisphaera mucosa]MDG3002732.1 glycosyltransferase family 87 protein [Paludisphaera mucosa]
MNRGWRIAIAAAFAAWVGLTAYDVRRKGHFEERDLVRNWVVGKYVVAGRDPYSLSRDILIAEYGVANPKGAWVSKIPSAVPEARRADVIPEYGPPEATYPPGAIGFLALGLGAIDDPATVLGGWFVLDVLLTLAVAALLARLWTTPPIPPGPDGDFWWILLVAILFTPVYATLDRAQFSLLVLALMLIVDDPKFAWPVRGVALGLALLKPSVCMPLFLLPLIRREWRVLATAALVQLGSTLYVAAKIGREPVSIFRDWLAVSRYFLSAGMYTVQEWVLPLSTRLPWVVPLVPLLLLAFCAATLYLHRDAPRARLFSLAGVTAVFWTYHGTYDAVLLLPMLLRRMGWSNDATSRPLARGGVLLFAALSIAYMDGVVGSPAAGWHAYRWAVRLGMIVLVVLEYVELYRDGRRGAFPRAPTFVPRSDNAPEVA